MADGSVIIDTELDQSGLKQGLASMASTVSTGITAALAAAGTALVALGTYSIKVGSQFESAISQVAATMGTTVDQISAIKEEASRLGATTAFSATQAAEGFNILAQSGLKAEEQIAAMSHVLNLAAAGTLSLDDAASYTIGTIKGFSDSCDNAQKYVDLIAKGATLANTSVGDFGEALSMSAATASTYNQTVEGTSLALLRLAEQNVTGSVAANTLNRAMADLYMPTAQAQKALDKLNVSCYDENGAARDLNDVIDDLNAALSGMTQEEANAYKSSIFTSLGLQAFNKMTVSSSDKVKELKEGLATASDALDGAGSAAQQAATMLDNLQGDITLLTSATDGFGNVLYDTLNTGETKLRSFVQLATSLMDEMTQAVKEGGLTGLVESLGDVLSRAVTEISSYIPKFVQSAVSLLKSFVDGLASSAPLIASVAAETANALLDGYMSIANELFVLGGELVISLAQGLAENVGSLCSTFADGLTQLISTEVSYLPKLVEAGATLLESLVQGILSALPSLLDAVPTIIDQLINGISESVQTILECVGGIILAIADALPELITVIVGSLPSLVQSIADGLLRTLPLIIETGVKLLTSLVGAMPKIVTTICLALPSLVSSIVGTLLGMIPKLVDCGVELLVSLVQALPDIIYAIVLVLPEIIASIVATLIACVPEIIQCGIELLVSLVSALPQIIVTIVAVIPSIIASIIAALIDSIPLIIQCGIELFVSLIEALPDIIVAIVGAIPQIIASIIDALISNIPVIINAGIQLFVSLISALPQIIATLIKAAPQIVKAIVDALIGLKDKFIEAGSNLLKGLGQGIANACGAVVNQAIAAGKKILNGVKSFFGINSPSKLFRDMIGKNLMLGLAGGIAEEAKTAVNAAKDVAEDIADVDFSIGAPDFDDTDYEALLENANSSVYSVHSDTATAVSSGVASAAYGTTDDDEEDAGDGDGKNPEFIQNDIYFGEKKVARILTPYIAKELDWEDK